MPHFPSGTQPLEGSGSWSSSPSPRGDICTSAPLLILHFPGLLSSLELINWEEFSQD